MTPLETVGLQHLDWALDEALFGGDLVASPADFRGRGIIVDITDHGIAFDLTPHRTYLIWRHRLTRRRGCAEMAPADGVASRRTVHWPRAMTRAEGKVECQLMISLADGGNYTSRTFLVTVLEDLSACVDDGDGFSLFTESIFRYQDAAAELLTLADDLRKEAAVGGFAGPPGEPGLDGKDGARGEPGPAGPAGFSPSAKVTTDGDGVSTLTVVDADGMTTATVLRGAQGDKGERGEPGPEGPQGPRGEKGPRGERGANGENGSSAKIIKDTSLKFGFSSYTTRLVFDTLEFEGCDLVEDSEHILGQVMGITDRNGKYEYTFELRGSMRGVNFCTCRELKLAVGETFKGSYYVEGVYIAPGDYAISFDTGVIAQVMEVVQELSAFSANVRLVGVANWGTVEGSSFATKDYVDEKIASLNDLSKMEF